MEDILLKLRNSKPSSEIKSLYSLIHWVLFKQKQNKLMFATLQTRINTTHISNKGYYKKHYEELSPEKRQHHLSVSKIYRSTDIVRSKSKNYQAEIRQAHRLYKDGELSEKSTVKIEKHINKLL